MKATQLLTVTFCHKKKMYVDNLLKRLNETFKNLTIVWTQNSNTY